MNEQPDQPVQPTDQNHDSNWDYSGTDAQQELAGSDIGEGVGVPMAHIEPVQWSASEYIESHKNMAWYMTLFVASALAVIIVYAITRDFLASFVIMFAAAAMTVFAGRKPDTKTYHIDDNGIQIDEKSYDYATFKSFSVVEEGALDSIWLKPIKRFSPMVVMYFAPNDEEHIVNVLSNFLPHEQRELDTIDRLTRRIRF